MMFLIEFLAKDNLKIIINLLLFVLKIVDSEEKLRQPSAQSASGKVEGIQNPRVLEAQMSRAEKGET